MLSEKAGIAGGLYTHVRDHMAEDGEWPAAAHATRADLTEHICMYLTFVSCLRERATPEKCVSCLPERFPIIASVRCDYSK